MLALDAIGAPPKWDKIVNSGKSMYWNGIDEKFGWDRKKSGGIFLDGNLKVKVTKIGLCASQ